MLVLRPTNSYVKCPQKGEGKLGGQSPLKEHILPSKFGSLQGGGFTLKGWYHKTEDKADKPWYDSLEHHTLKRELIYNRVPPPEDPILSHIEQPPMDDDHPTHQEA